MKIRTYTVNAVALSKVCLKNVVIIAVLVFGSCSLLPAQILTDSNLPIVIINTDGNVAIPDEPGVLGTMKIIYRGEGQRNYVSDQNDSQVLNYNGRIDIEIRGSSSQELPKKQYG